MLLFLRGVNRKQIKKEEMTTKIPREVLWEDKMTMEELMDDPLFRVLHEASIDSIKSFTGKFGYYVGIHPESRNDHYYDPTVDNLRYALSLYGYQLRELSASVTVNDEWAGQRYLFY